MLARLIGFAALTIVTVLGNVIIVIAICVEPRLKSVRIFLNTVNTAHLSLSQSRLAII
jgi:hypothetical protein